MQEDDDIGVCQEFSSSGEWRLFQRQLDEKNSHVYGTRAIVSLVFEETGSWIA